MTIRQDVLDMLPKQYADTAEDVISSLWWCNRGSVAPRFEEMVAAYADLIGRTRATEQHRRDLYITAALTGFCREPLDGTFIGIAADAIRAADETLYSVDAPDLLATLRGQVALLEDEVKRLKDEVFDAKRSARRKAENL